MRALGSRQVYADRWLAVREDTVRRDDGSIGTYTLVESGDIVLVIPVDAQGFYLVEQYRHPVAARRWEFPSGNIDASVDADVVDTAGRELREEAGLLAGCMSVLGRVEITPSTMTQRCTVVLATDLTQTAHQRDPEEQDMRSAWFGRDDVMQMIRDGELVDGKSLAAFALMLTTLPEDS
ncbi:NUDIX hydrolase [Nocardioides sp. CCNWLW239]|uniref:NUDIX hydrolase n=1 Tax=Nocardioides sp. CCNWLW239 TaxID=3128902 RepID=UPI0030180656